MRKTGFFSLAAALALAVPAICFGDNNKTDHTNTIRRNYDIFTSVVNLIDENYVDSLPLQDMFDDAIKGFLRRLDPYTSFYDAREAARFLADSKGEFGGLGIYFHADKKENELTVSQFFENSPAKKAGMRVGDKIIRVDSLEIDKNTLTDFRDKIYGLPGTPVNVRVKRPFTTVGDSVIDFTLSRIMLARPTVSYFGVDADGIGYIALDQFGENTVDEMRNALESLLADKNLKGIVIDLVDNPGGTLDAVMGVVEYFVPKGSKVLTTKSKTREKEFVTTRKPLVPADMPLAVLINGSSASAAEVFAGAIQDLDRGVLVGERSFGKGLVQSTMSTPYLTMLKLTTSKYYIPSGRLIQAYDYSRRNPDGSVAHVPDSLAKQFRTKAGRIVYDGGGLTPDSVLKPIEFKPVTVELYDKDKMFDYAVKYASEHKTAPSLEDFKITDEIFDDFIAFVDPATFSYTSAQQEILKDLKKSMEEDELLTDEARKRLDAVAEILNPDIESEMREARIEIENILVPLILNCYYTIEDTNGVLHSMDPDYKVGAQILLNPDLYKKLLSAPAATPSTKKK